MIWYDYTPKVCRGLKRFLFCYGEHTQEPLAAPEVVIAYRGIVLLTGRVQYVDLYLLSI